MKALTCYYYIISGNFLTTSCIAIISGTNFSKNGPSMIIVILIYNLVKAEGRLYHT